MNTAFTIFHGVLAVAAAILMSVFGDDRTGILATAGLGVTVLYCLVANVLYARSLDGARRTATRAKADRQMAILVGLVLPAGLTLAAVATAMVSFDAQLDWGSIEAACLLGVELGFIGVFLSSVTDRYLVLPWRDGVTGPPPYQRSDRGPYTRLWLIHRIFGTCLFFIAIWAVSGLVWFKAYESAADSDWLLFLLSLASPVMIPVVLMREWVRHLGTAFAIGFGSMDVRVGDYVEIVDPDDDDGAAGIVYEVSTDRGYTVLGRNGKLYRRPLSDTRGQRPTLRNLGGMPEAWPVDEALQRPEAEGLGDAADYLALKDVATPSRWLVF